MAASVNRFAPAVRGEGKGLVVPMAQWVDDIVLGAAVASTYTLPTGTNPAGGGSQAVNPPPGTTVTASILRISNGTSTPVFVSSQSVASAAGTLAGAGSIIIPGNGSLLFAVPGGVASISLFSTPGGNVSIEAWW